MDEDLYLTIAQPGQGQLREKMSRFLAFAHPVASAEEARTLVKRYQNEYHDSRHVCWAYMIGPDRLEWQLNDNGEPSGTAGKPILGQINSLGVTDVVVIVVRYFGGIKLGTPGLIAAYRAAARLALEDAGTQPRWRSSEITAEFPYESADPVMRIIKNEGISILGSTYDNTCSLRLSVRKSRLEELSGRLEAAGASLA